jgi:hypothetical protein
MDDLRILVPVFAMPDARSCRHCGGKATARFDYGARLMYCKQPIATGWFCGCTTPNCKGFVFNQKRCGSEFEAVERWNKMNEKQPVYVSTAESCSVCEHAHDGAVIDGMAFENGWHCDVNDVAGTGHKSMELYALCRMPEFCEEWEDDDE